MNHIELTKDILLSLKKTACNLFLLYSQMYFEQVPFRKYCMILYSKKLEITEILGTEAWIYTRRQLENLMRLRAECPTTISILEMKGGEEC